MSTLLADTIRKTGGTAGVDIRVKNTSVYESEGGTSVTQNLVQGLVKAWNHINDADAGTIVQGDSLNTSSAIDNGVGTFRFPLTNAMASVNYLHIGNPGPAADHYTQVALKDQTQQNSIDARATSSFAIRIRNSGNSDDDVEDVGIGLVGDLA